MKLEEIEREALIRYPETDAQKKVSYSLIFFRKKLRDAFVEGSEFTRLEIQNHLKKQTVFYHMNMILRTCSIEQMKSLRDWLNSYDFK